MPTPLRPSLAPYEAYPLFEVLQRTASRLPNKTAVIDGDRTFTFAQLDGQSDRFAAALSGLGVEKGDRAGLFVPNCAEFVTAYFGILKTGATVAPVNAAYRSRELTHQLDNSSVQGSRLASARSPGSRSRPPRPPWPENRNQHRPQRPRHPEL